MPQICNIHEWFSAKIGETKPISEAQFVSYLQQHCQRYKFTNKQLYKPHTENNAYLLVKNEKNYLSEGHHRHLPNLIKNLRCFNFLDRTSQLTKYVVIPFDYSRFGIMENQTWNSRLINMSQVRENVNVNIGIWDSNIEWLKTIKKSELWTDDSCMLVRYDIWQKYKKQIDGRKK